MPMCLSKHEERTHAKLSPSGFAKWGYCPLSLALEETLPPEEEKPYAEWGTARHEEAEAVLTRNADLPKDEEAAMVVKVYTDYCKSLGGSPQIVEGAVSLASYGLPEIHGTADFITEVDRVLHIVDLKAGVTPVVAENNGQLKIYALGAATADRLLYYEKIVMTIVQPRVSPQISTVELTPFELINWLENTLKPAVERTKQPHPKANPSEKTCQWCRAKPICKAYSERVTVLAQQSFDEFAPRDLTSLTPEELSKIIPHLGEIEKYLKALKAHAKSFMEQGGLIPGFKLVQGRKSRKWRNEEEAKKFCLRKIKKEDAYEFKFRSPAQIEKHLKNTKHAGALKELIEVKPGAPTIAPIDDKRPAIVNGAVLAFKDVNF